MATRDDVEFWVLRVRSDPSIPPVAVRAAESVLPLADRNPELAMARLKELAYRECPKLRCVAPTQDLAKCVGVEAFWEYYLHEDIRAFFPSPVSYRRFIESRRSQAESLRDHLRTSDPLLPWINSWVVPAAHVEGMSAERLVAALATEHQPPLIVLRLSAEKMQRSGLGVRKPVALDALLGGHRQWDPDGLPSGIPEFIDRAIPSRVVTVVEWRV